MCSRINRFFTLLLVAFVALALVFPGASLADSPEDILVVANQLVPVGNISPVDLKNIFLKKKSLWGQGMKAVPVNAPEGSKLRKDFRGRFLEMSENEVKSYWESYKIRHGGTEPPSFSNTLKAVFKLKGAVSYVYRSQYKEGVAKILLVLPAG